MLQNGQWINDTTTCSNVQGIISVLYKDSVGFHCKAWPIKLPVEPALFEIGTYVFNILA